MFEINPRVDYVKIYRLMSAKTDEVGRVVAGQKLLAVCIEDDGKERWAMLDDPQYPQYKNCYICTLERRADQVFVFADETPIPTEMIPRHVIPYGYDYILKMLLSIRDSVTTLIERLPDEFRR